MLLRRQEHRHFIEDWTPAFAGELSDQHGLSPSRAGLFLAPTRHAELGGRYAHQDEVVANLLSAACPYRQRVIARVTDVRVAFDADNGFGMLPKPLRLCTERGLRGRA